MIRQPPSETAKRSQISEAYYDQFPSCEYCGHVVFPGEEQSLDHGSLYWHSAHCFRCYGCHKEFSETVQCHLLMEIALCNECYPRREFLVEEYKSLKKGEALSNKHPRVCFLSPVTRPNTENNPFPNFQDTGTDELVNDQNPFNYVPRRLAFAQNYAPGQDGSVNARFADCPDNLPPMPNYAVGNDPADGLKAPPSLMRDVTADDEAARRTAANLVAAQIKAAMEALSSDEEVVPSSNPTETPTRAFGNESKIKAKEKLVVDDKFTVMAVNEWEDFERRSPTDMEYINRNANIDCHQNDWISGASCSAQSGQNVTEDPDAPFRSSRLSVRRTSSCSDLFKTEFIPGSRDLLGDSFPTSCESNHSECPVTFRTLDSDSQSERVRGPDRCCSPTPVLQSSTPIPLNSSQSSDRPPSSFCGRNDVPQKRDSGRRTNSPLDVSSGSNGKDAEVHSVKEIRAMFQRISPKGNIAKICSDCKKEVLPMERFDCLNQVYHIRCFRCTRCRAHLNAQTFRDDGKQPYCKICFLDLKVSRNRVPRSRHSPPRYRLNSL